MQTDTTQEYRKDPDRLLKKLGGRRDGDFFFSVIVPAYAGMDRGTRNREGHDGEQRGTPRP